jgi:sterol desaturase/sphingolipid hydroxylase (fatty acid hydroxylase superfamily)
MPTTAHPNATNVSAPPYPVGSQPTESAATAADRYRAKVRPKVSPNYSGSMHLAILLASSLTGVVVPLCCLERDAALAFHVATVVPLALVYGNICEYVAHRYGGHAHEAAARLPFVASFRKYHAVVHHSFFASGAWEIEQQADLFFVSFPSFIYVMWAVCVATPLALVGPLLFSGGGTTPWLLATSTMSYTLFQYEALHAFNHRALPPPIQSLLEQFAPLRSMQERHRVHHQKADVNYNITWAWTDRLVGTLAAAESADALRASRKLE